MSRLPTPGGDAGNWGEILNDFLKESHNTDGTLRDNSVTAAQIAPNTLTKADIGLADVDNTSDLAKPVSTATQAAINALRIPRVAALSDGAVITLDADTTDIATVTIGGNRSFAAPTGTPVTGQRIIIAITQDGAGGRSVSWDSVFRFSADIPYPTLTVTPGATDYIAFLYNQTANSWDCVTFIGGY